MGAANQEAPLQRRNTRHRPLHRRPSREAKMITVCEQCGADVKTKPSKVAKGHGRYCSCACRNRARWRAHILEISRWFWERVDQSGGVNACWPWTGRRMKAGYGRLVIKGKHEGAHRIAYELAVAAVPNGLFVCHHCDNPPCCNPHHLYAGTHQDNVDDKVRRGRASGRYPLKARLASQKEG